MNDRTIEELKFSVKDAFSKLKLLPQLARIKPTPDSILTNEQGVWPDNAVQKLIQSSGQFNSSVMSEDNRLRLYWQWFEQTASMGELDQLGRISIFSNSFDGDERIKYLALLSKTYLNAAANLKLQGKNDEAIKWFSKHEKTEQQIKKLKSSTTLKSK
ncbi:hypothetical protein A3A74_07715 [Candidatus Roizmanbacteria bacterium RIFCSPLOWO2_01_FULL_35_13]|uniref:Uncharacterized protein n=1 Tax=Candidatus Roizmanbacteria bacterium RIFCSPLOWO2_01_FULL_35_13 TaxID=1802055 RepID=A0A1F7I8F8_9BACT|nr:MAG: hypothetical protein A3A74_07715 [Candidatus Roizmanbacteria bacterium RIFCSPLOWO2_01_FULL_35_13]